MTAFGKRQLKRWLLAPLMDIEAITQRQNAVEDLMKIRFEVGAMRTRLGKLPDVEKLLAKIFTYSIKQRIKAIYFEDVSLKKLQEFRQLLKIFAQSEDLLRELI